MGAPIPPIDPPIDPGPPGTSCSICWGPGKPFGPGPTPEILQFNISGVEKGPGWIPSDGEPPNQDFAWSQRAGFPCFWFRGPLIFRDFFSFEFPGTLALITSSTNIIAFGGAWEFECQTVMENQLDNPFIGGTLTLLNAINQ